MKEPNYYETFMKMADIAWNQISTGIISIDEALELLKGVLEAKNEQGKRQGIAFEHKQLK
jgi:hypothetical protein